MFEQGELVSYWYLLLSGELELYLPGERPCPLSRLQAGALFGELGARRHSCAARVRRSAEFVRIAQAHLLAVYSVSAAGLS